MLDRSISTTLAVLLIGSGSSPSVERVRVSNRAEHELFTRSQVDQLTGLPNRVQLISAIGEVLDDTWRTESRPSPTQVNLDRFKNINDSLGTSSPTKSCASSAPAFVGWHVISVRTSPDRRATSS